MGNETGIANISIARILAFMAAVITSLAIVNVVQTNKAQAAWANISQFNQTVVNRMCPAGTNAVNFYNRIDGWYCIKNTDNGPAPTWIRPGDACKRTYGASFSFVMTNMNYKFGGFCARWV